MKFFARSQPDPLSARTQALSKEIARLEAEIAVLADNKPKAKSAAAVASREVPPPKETAPAPAPNQPSTQRVGAPPQSPKPVPNRPKRATTAGVPHIPEVTAAGVRTGSPSPTETVPTATQDPHFNDLGVRKYDLLSAWRRLTHHLSGPTSNNPKMVHYLAAGSIQGLRPLRYERRVARNRFLAFLALLLLVLWGLAYWSFKR
jgi:hypothetical protein